MKKIFCSFILIMLIIGVSGCMKQPTEKENKENELAMLSYLEDKYNEEFRVIDYIAAERGFNDFYNRNILTVESEKGILVNVREQVNDPGYFYDDYVNAYASKIIDEKINYENIGNLQYGKTYVTLRSYDINLTDLESEDFSYINETIQLYCLISVSGKSDESILEELYDVYKQVNSLGFETYSFIVAFGGDHEKKVTYAENFLLNFTEEWEQFDVSINEMLKTTEKDLSFDEFKDRLIVIGD